MGNKRKLIISVLLILVIVMVSVGGTYAYFMFVTNSGTTLSASSKLDIDYHISNASVSGTLIPSATRSGGVMETVTAKLNSGSVPAAINLYITPTEIEGFPASALNWEVDVVDTSSNILNHYSGNFSTATINTPYKIVDAYPLTSNLLTFNIYIWLNGQTLTNQNFDSDNEFTATITADSVHITGEFD